MNKQPETAIIRRITPSFDNARYAVKRAVGEEITVEADIFKEGHDAVTALLKWRRAGDELWRETPMIPLGNDRWSGTLCVTSPGAWEFTIEAWGDVFFSWQQEIGKKFGAGLTDLRSETLEGAAFVEAAAVRAKKSPDATGLKAFAAALHEADAAEAHAIANDPGLCALLTAYADRSLATTASPAWT